MNKKISVVIFLAIVVAGFQPLIAQARTRIQAVVPVSLQIPKINVTATVESRGLNAQKIMRLPSSGQTVAWFSGGVKPGQPGDAVMYGHLTGTHFEPTIFFNLYRLRRNDRLVVTDAKGNRHTWRVTKVKTYRADQITFAQLSGPTQFIHLNLYTCAGHWDQRLRHYTEFLVVYSDLVSSVAR